MISYTTMSFTNEHVEAAARLFSRNYRAARQMVSSMPACYENHERIVPLLNDMIKRSPAIVALQDGEIVGYLGGHVLREWRGRRTAYAPFWAHAADEEDPDQIYRLLYACLASQWIANGCFQHLVTALAHDTGAREALSWMGFGMVVVDTMRDMTRLHTPANEIRIKQADMNDIETIEKLDNKLATYLAGPPVFLPLIEKRGKQYHEEWLTKPYHALWLASRDGETVAYLKMCPLDADYLVTDEKTIWIQGAYTKKHARGQGIGTALVDHAIAWAQGQGFKRCAVDFESDNALACRLWLKHFRPICYSFARRVDPRIAWAYAGREDKHFWS
ncbi:MAG: GNAT family N-acetyltransferase [candidate division WOR-3 bacterium]|nr:MAG: GNAT family N-acetyltransferase [candidate division WOR-3 bacterium]